jgi:outer membrane protein OmpA-like peptidoglycan-associated protein
MDNKKWAIKDDNNASYLLKKGSYLISSKSDNKAWSATSYNQFNVDEDFTLETSIKLKGKPGTNYGFIWNRGANYEINVILSDKSVKIEKIFTKDKSVKILLDWKKIDAIKIGNYNKIKIVKKANLLFYYVNEMLIYHSGINQPRGFYANGLGFFVFNKGVLSADYVKFTSYPATVVKTIDNPDPNIYLEKLDTNINSSVTEDLPRISPDGNYLYCIRSSNLNVGGDPKMDDIWYSVKKEDGSWSKLKNIGRPLNNASHNFVISISPDNNSLLIANCYDSKGEAEGMGLSITKKVNDKYTIPTNQKIIDFVNKNNSVSYFLCTDNKTLLIAAETPEGLGEKDMYVSFLVEENTWSKPKSLGKVVNSLGDEHSPYLSADGKTLFYSSDGIPGYGEYDVFVSERLDDSWQNWTEPKNLGNRINTKSSETGYILTAKGDYAYLSSNGDICRIKNPAYVEPVVIVSGKVFDKKTGKPLGASITYSNLSENKELGIASSDAQTGDYKIVLQKGQAYGFMATKSDYYSISENIDLTNLKEYKEIKQDLYLSPIVRGEPIRLNNIFFEFGKSVLKAESFPELDRLVNILNKNPEIKIEINGHTDDVGTDASNQVLSQDRAQSVVTYLQSKGISAGRLSAKGYGESKPDVPNNSDENRAFNRRVEFKIL